MSRSVFVVFAAMVSFVVAALSSSCATPLDPTIEVTPPSRTLVSGDVIQLTVTRRFSGGGVEDVTNKVVYTTTDKTIATVTDRGIVTAGEEAGSVLIRVTDPASNATGAAALTVEPARIASIEVSPSPAIVMARGATRQFGALARYSNGTTKDVTGQVLWSSSNEAAAIVGNTPSDKGVVTAIAQGDSNILATDATTNVQGRTIVFVTGTETPQLKAILVTPNPGALLVGQATQFAALGVLSDGTTLDVTSQVSWSSSRVDVATIDAAGLARGVASGEVTITATGAEPNTAIKGSAALKAN